MTELKILTIKKKFNGKNTDDPFVGYVFVGVTQGGQQTDDLVYFCRPGNPKLAPNSYYRGNIKQQNGEDKNDIFNNVEKIDGWGGLDDPFAETYTQNEADERQCSILAQSDIHSAMPIVAKMLDSNNSGVNLTRSGKVGGDMTFDKPKGLITLIKCVALTCRDARLELTEDYYKELKASNGKEE